MVETTAQRSCAPHQVGHPPGCVCCSLHDGSAGLFTRASADTRGVARSHTLAAMTSQVAGACSPSTVPGTALVPAPCH